MGSLALGANASGAFSVFLLRQVTLDDVARISAEQMVELARFVAQVNPDVLRQVLSMLAYGPAAGSSGTPASCR